MSTPNKKLIIIVAFFIIYVIWGSTYLLNKIAITQLPPFYLSGIRFTLSGILIAGIAKLMRLKLAITRKQFLNCIISGFLFLVYGNGVFVWALKYVDSGFAALEAATQPLFVLLLMRLIDRKEIKRKSIIGIVLGLIGMYLLVSQQEIVTNQDSIIGILMIFTCVLAWSYASVFVSKADLPASFFVSTGYQMFIAGILLMLTSILFGEDWISPFSWNMSVQWSVIGLIIFGSIIAFSAFNFLLKEVSAEKVATSAYVNPIIALFLGWIVLDEQLTLQSIIAAIILLTGVYFITASNNKNTS